MGANAEIGDVGKAGEEEDWKNKTIDRGWWKRLSDEAAKKFLRPPIYFPVPFSTPMSLPRTSVLVLPL